MPFFAAQQSLFRAYDIRGSRQHFTSDFVDALGKAFVHLYTTIPFPPKSPSLNSRSLTSSDRESKRPIVVIGYDVRCGSERLAQTLANILARYGIKVVQLGLITTPMMAFWAEQYQGHGIVVTASHSAKDILGIKWLIDHKSPNSTQIQRLYQQLTHGKSYDPSQNLIDSHKENQEQNISLSSIDSAMSHRPTDLTCEQVATTYMTAITHVFEQLYPSNAQNCEHNSLLSDKLDVTVVIDCMNGATSTIAQRLFERFCRQVIMLNDTPDGSFPKGNPDPTEPDRLEQLQQSVVDHDADIGMAFDGDGDRLMIVDNSGNIVTSDHLLYLLAKIALAECPKPLADSLSTPQILFDIKCSHHLPTLLTELGSEPVLSKTGSSLMRQQMQHTGSRILFAGELSGHFIFNDSRFIIYDDAMYAALRLLHWLSASNGLGDKRALTDITQCLPAMISTADHYLPIPKTTEADCSIVEQLARLCQYLRTLVAVTNANDADRTLLDTCPSSLCGCSAHKQYMTLEQASHLLPVGTKLSCIDGVRLDFAHGFGVLRQSNTSHHLTARFAGDSLDDLKDIQSKFAALCRPFDQTLAVQIATIPAESTTLNHQLCTNSFE
ncbi:phosphomannomutase [Psychrobacter sp. B38]|uniref:phosphomannomutase n=1 Tax=Psychrobacter sp. B38 TaxID=3143538 RepID=UPI00320FB1D5